MVHTRRFLLRGLFQGSAAVVSLPFLDCFLDSKGKAVAATGRAIPTRFGTFFWGCGLTKALYLPKTVGANYEDTPQLASLKPYKKKLNLLSGFRAYIDDKPNIQHWTGNAAITTGIAPANDTQFDAQTLPPLLVDDRGPVHPREGILRAGASHGGVVAVVRIVSPALPVTMTLKIFLSFAEKEYLMPAIRIEIRINEAHILLNAMRLRLRVENSTNCL